MSRYGLDLNLLQLLLDRRPGQFFELFGASTVVRGKLREFAVVGRRGEGLLTYGAQILERA